MKKQSSLRQSLGLKQIEIATLLNVSRSQWSMYESGKRNLPTHAVALLSEIVTHVNSKEADASKTDKRRETGAHQLQLIEHLLRENEYERLMLEKKINATEKRHSKELAQMQLTDFVSQRRNSSKGEPWPLVAPKINTKPFADSHEAQLLRYDLRKQSLAFEEQVLQKKLKALQK